jgi:isoleucyl-tRNA synthetase
VLPDLKRLGPKLGKRLPALKSALASADASKLLAELEANKQVAIELPDGPVALDVDDLQVRLQAKPGWAAAQGKSAVVVLSTELTEALISEGLARELVHLIQTQRRDMALKYTDRIRVGIVTESRELEAAAHSFAEYIKRETLATELRAESLNGTVECDAKLGESTLKLYVAPQD